MREHQLDGPFHLTPLCEDTSFWIRFFGACQSQQRPPPRPLFLMRSYFWIILLPFSFIFSSTLFLPPHTRGRRRIFLAWTMRKHCEPHQIPRAGQHGLSGKGRKRGKILLIPLTKHDVLTEKEHQVSCVTCITITVPHDPHMRNRGTTSCALPPLPPIQLTRDLPILPVSILFLKVKSD